ncbi:MAG: hypothetical protein EXR79_09910 [Myxococcales bacterium]|nr:hypothetical protein [Myxococcales bacterium]
MADVPPGLFAVERRLDTIGVVVGSASSAGMAWLRRHPSVADLQADTPVHSQLVQVAKVTRAAVAWSYGALGAGVRVAVLDTGVDATHPALAGKVLAQHCFAGPGTGGCPPWGQAEADAAPDGNGHGTHVASIIAGAAGAVTPGLAPASELVAVRVLGKNGKGTTADVVAALDWVGARAAKWNVRVINLSLGSDAVYAGSCGGKDPATTKAVAVLRTKGVAVVVASGNGGALAGLSAPACVPGAIAVGASYDTAAGSGQWPGLCTDKTTGTRRIACFTNRGPRLDIVAPGAWTLAAKMGGGVTEMAGTSQAAPVVAAAAALLAGCKPTLSPSAIRSVLVGTGRTVTDASTGLSFRHLDIGAAAAAVCGP